MATIDRRSNGTLTLFQCAAYTRHATLLPMCSTLPSSILIPTDQSAIIVQLQTELALVRAELATVRAERDQLRAALVDLLADQVQLRAQLADTQAHLAAVEVEFPAVRRNRSRQLRAWACQLGLAVTGGSDCHGPGPRAPGSCSISIEELALLRPSH